MLHTDCPDGERRYISFLAVFVRNPQGDAVIAAPEYLSLALNRYPLGAAQEILAPANSAVMPGLSGKRRVVLLISHPSLLQMQLQDLMDDSFSRIDEREYSSQNGIHLVVYDTSQNLHSHSENKLMSKIHR